MATSEDMRGIQTSALCPIGSEHEYFPGTDSKECPVGRQDFPTQTPLSTTDLPL